MGHAVGLDRVESFTTGSQAYVVAPKADKLAQSPRHIVVSLLVDNVNAWSIFRSMVSVILHPNPSITANTYSVVTIGEANGFNIASLLSPIEGVQFVVPIDEEPFN